MKQKTFEELGKGFITFGNSVAALSVIYGLFGKSQSSIPTVFITIIIIYIVISSYMSGIILLEKGAAND